MRGEEKRPPSSDALETLFLRQNFTRGRYFGRHLTGDLPVKHLSIAATRISKATKSFATNNSGATAIEYGLIAGLISVVIISAVTSIGTRASAKFQAVADNLK